MSTHPQVTFPLDSLPEGAAARSVTAQPGRAGGRPALRVFLTEQVAAGSLGVDFGDQPTFVIVPAEFCTGTIEVDVLGRLTPDAPDLARGFVGLAYHLTDGGDRFESVYLRPANGTKANPPSPRDRRAIQYFAYPDWPYDRLREVYPDGRYESAADIGLDEWIHLRVDVEPARITASVDGVVALVVGEIKAEPVSGDLGLFVDIGTDAYFANLTISPDEPPSGSTSGSASE